jgi:hypothetical protein
MSSNTNTIETYACSGGADSDGVSATLYLRSGAGGTVERRQADLRERFEGLRERVDAIDMALERWSRTVVTPTKDDRSAEAVSTYRALSEAVEAAGGRLEPFFEARARRGGILVGRPDGRRITFPVACLVVRAERAPVGCYPCWLDGTHYSLEDGLEALASGDPTNLR